MLCHRGVGGSARVAVELATALATRGHVPYVFARSPPFGLVDGAGGVGMRTLDAGDGLSPRLDGDWSAADLDALAELIAGVELDVLHYHYAFPFAAVADAVRTRLGAAAPAIVGTLHGTDVSHCPRGRAAALAPLLARADVLTAVSHSLASAASELFGLARAPVVVSNFIDLQRFRPGVRGAGARRRIAHVSNLRPVKQPGAMARIYAATRRRVDAELWLVGGGDGMATVDTILNAAGVTNGVVRFGLRTDLEAILPQADVLLMTSCTESFCLAALEAAACGVPTVAPRVGGLPELVRDGCSGVLFEPGDEDGAAGELVALLHDDLRRARMGKAARAVAVELAATAVVPRYETLYRAVACLGQDDGDQWRVPSCAS